MTGNNENLTLNKVDRTDRDVETRETQESFSDWKPGRILPDGIVEEGYECKWVRAYIHNTLDTGNINKAYQEGWDFVPFSPELAKKMKIFRINKRLDSNDPLGDYIQVRDSVLMQRPKELGERVRMATKQRAERQIEAIDNNLMNIQDSKMKTMFADRKTTITYGRGDGGE